MTAADPELVQVARASSTWQRRRSMQVIAVHGIGRPAPGTIEAALRGVVGKERVDVSIDEVNWNSLVDDPFDPQTRRASLRAVAELSRLWIRTAETGFTPPWSHSVPRWQRIVLDGLAVATFILSLLLPAAVVVCFPAMIAATRIDDFIDVNLLAVVLDAAPDVTLLLLCLPWVGAALQLIAASLTRQGRLAFLPVLRRSVVHASWPLQVLTFAAASSPGVTGAMLGVLAGLLALPYLVTPSSSGADATDFAMIGLIVLGAFVVAFSLGRLLRVLGEWPLKLALDVARYVADGRYRRRLHIAVTERLRAAVAKESPGGTVILAAHSLGTVICLDTLLGSPKFRGSRGVDFVFVTMGSPISRLFQRFFAGVYVDDLDLAAQTIRARFRTLRWVNIHRPLDYVGGRLATKGAIHNCSTGQHQRMHADYWADPAVLRVFEDALGVARVPTQRGPAGRRRPWMAGRGSPVAHIAPVMRGVPALFAAGLAAATLAFGGYWAVAEWHPRALDAYSNCLREKEASYEFWCGRGRDVSPTFFRISGFATSCQHIHDPARKSELLAGICVDVLAGDSVWRRYVPAHSSLALVLAVLALLLAALIGAASLYGSARAALRFVEEGLPGEPDLED